MIETFTAILVVITAIYAYLTLRIAKASEASVSALLEQSWAANRPFVTISPFIRPKALFLYLRIRNDGRTAAENVRLELDRDFFQWGDSKDQRKNLRTQNAFSQPIDSLAPGAELLFGLGQGYVIFGDNVDQAVTPHQFNITANYSALGRDVREVTRIDLRPYLNSEGESDPLVEELERVRKVLDAIAKK